MAAPLPVVEFRLCCSLRGIRRYLFVSVGSAPSDF